MDIGYLEKCAERHHKGTLAIAEKLVGLPEALIESCPVVVKKATDIYLYMPNSNAQHIDSDYVNPYIMNGAFSLELKMKFLHALETGTKLEAGHRLLDLFALLTNESKEFLRSNLKSMCKESEKCKATAKYFKHEIRVEFNWEMHKLLSNSDMAFERWRYIYEKKDSTWFAGYTEIQKVLDLRISNLK